MQALSLVIPSLFSFQGVSPERKRKPIEREESSDIVGVFNGEGPPVPIPNTEVKLTSADDTCLETDRENRSTPTQRLWQLVKAFVICLLSSTGRACGC